MKKCLPGKEIKRLREKGWSFQQIADVCGVSVQLVHKELKKHMDKYYKGAKLIVPKNLAGERKRQQRLAKMNKGGSNA